jgi:anthranilate phosphoribosyltransferase
MFRQGVETVLFEEEAAPARVVVGHSPAVGASATASWIREALEGRIPLPHPLVNQLACCLFASGYTDDMNQAKAIAAVEARGLTSPERSGAGEGRRSRAVF